MKSMSRLFLCLVAAPLFAQSSYPPAFKDARVETYRKIDSSELKLWIFGESDPKVQKPAIVFFFGGGWSSGSPGQFENQARHFAKRGMIAITADYRVKSHFITAT
jgi:acetyl esterase/lipase